MEVIAIINRKGGVGKTATAQNLGAGLLQKNYKVLFVDLDSQGNLSYGLGSDQNAPGSMEVLEQKITLRDAIQHTEAGDIVSGSDALAGADTTIRDTGKEYRLKEALESVAGLYDYCIIDTPAALGTLTVNALTAADNIIIPVQADIYSLQGIGQLKQVIDTVKKYCNKALYIRGILITRYNARSILSQDMQSNLEETAEELGTILYKTPIRECISIKEAQACREDIFTYAPKSNAAKDYGAFIQEFLTQKG